MQRNPHNIRSFEGFTLDLTRGCLLRANQEVKLRPKPFEALAHLVDNAGRLINKAELIQVLWPETAVTDDSLVQCMMEVRRALGDEKQEIVKTVPRRGYIFDKPVMNGPTALTTYTEETGVQLIIEEEENAEPRRTATGSAAAVNVSLVPQHKSGSARLVAAIKNHKLVAAFSVLTVTLVTAGIIYLTRPGEAIDSIAVMPFVNATGDPNMEYMSDGLSENVIDRLSQMPNLKRVIAFASVVRYKGKTDPQVIGRELGVKAVLHGRLSRHGDQILIGVELVNVQDNRRLWGGQFERSVSDLPSMTGDLAAQITDRLRLKLTSDDQKYLNKRDTNSAEAYQLFLKGRYFWSKGMNQSALEAYQQAIEKDANYALAYDGVADCYLVFSQNGFVSPEEGYSKARWAAAKAMELDRSLAEPRITLAEIKANYDWDWRGAEADFRQAIELNPNVGHAAYGNYLSLTGRHAEGIAEVKKQQEIDPLSLRINSNLGWEYYLARQYDQAIEQCKKTIELEPNFMLAHRMLGHVYLQKKMYAEAISEFETVQQLTKFGSGRAGLGYAYALAGEREDALKIIDELKAQTQNEYAPGYWLAIIYAGLGEKDLAFEWLEKAVSRHDPAIKGLKVDPAVDPLRSDYRFENLLRRMNLS